MSWAAIASAVVGAGLSAGVAYASQPTLTDPAKSSKKTALAALKALPGQRQVEAAARMGKAVTYDADNWLTPKQAFQQGFIDEAQYQRLRRAEKESGQSFFEGLTKNFYKNVLTDSAIPGGALGDAALRVSDGHIKINVKKRKADFTGYGDADVQGKLARDMAQIGLDLQGKYGTDFINEAKAQQERADPEGTAARKLLASEINRMEDERKTRERPVAGALDSQVIGELERGTGLDDSSAAAIESVLKRRGDSTADVAGALESGPEGEARKQARVQKALGYLSSGASPDDAAFREEQQSLANMSNFLAGRTPQSQFQSLSGAQQGAAPNVNTPALPGVQPGMQQQADNAGLQGYASGIRAAAGNVSPWFAGLSLLTRGLNAGASAFGTPKTA